MKLNSLILICYLLLGCQGSVVKTNIIKSSYDSNASRRNGVFVSSFEPSKKILDFGGVGVEIDDVWVEYLWSHTNLNKDISIKNQKNLYLKFKDTEVFDFELLYGVNYTKKGGYTDDKLTFKLDTIVDKVPIKLIYMSDTADIILIKK